MIEMHDEMNDDEMTKWRPLVIPSFGHSVIFRTFLDAAA